MNGKYLTTDSKQLRFSLHVQILMWRFNGRKFDVCCFGLQFKKSNASVKIETDKERHDIKCCV